MAKRALLPLESLLQAEIPDEQNHPPAIDVQHGKNALHALPLADAVFELIAEAAAQPENWDPYVRAVVRGTVRSVRAHARALEVLAHEELWVPMICELRSFVEAVMALAAMWRAPDDEAIKALELRRVVIKDRMLKLGCQHVYDQLYGPLSNVAHNGYSAISCQTQSEDSSLTDPLPEIGPESDHFVVVTPGGDGFVMTFRPIPAAVGYARYLPMVATIVASAAVWLAKEFKLELNPDQSSVGQWLAAHGVADFDCFPT